ncbi:glycosyltransferase family 4 protein [ANME-1 cluster archaeon AG-394-G21]|nr:glycosyltransferase family 4 protein [ANME-1 cluster archaeon AG-394-G21]
MKSTNLLIITDRYPHNKDPVTSYFVYSQIDALKKYFDTIYVISLNPFIPKLFSKFSFMHPRWRKDAFAMDYSYDNVEVRFARYFMLPFDFVKERKGELAYNVAKRIIEREKIEFDLIHAHFTWPSGYVGAKLKEKCGKPLIITGHGHDVYDLPFNDVTLNKKIRSTLNAADCIITVSKSNYDKLMQLDISDEKVSVIPNGYDLDLFKNIPINKARERLNLPKDKKIILSVGYLEQIKGHKYLINAMKEIVKRRTDVLCIIVGNGKLRNELEMQIKELELEDYIRLAGEKPHQKIPLWMNACDVFVLPSLRESFGVVQIEAMACGKPVVATYNGGSEEIIISEDYGLLCEPANPEELAEKILIALDKEWDGEKILKYAERFRWENIVKEILEVYKDVSVI